MSKRLFFFIFLSLICLVAFPQVKNKYKYELIGGIGPSGFLGDLGGYTPNGTHVVNDLNFRSTRYAFNAGVRYRDHPRFGFKAMFTAGLLYGNDSLSKNIYRHNRNLNFRSPIIEISAQAEYYLRSESTKTLYNAIGLKSKRKKRKVTVYIFAGVGVFYYNPQEKAFNDNWYNIRKYHLEGQGLPGGPKQFSNFNIAIPAGIGFRKLINKRWSIGAEFGIRKTFTDYIDGVSGVYYDKTKLLQAYGPTAVALADPNLGKIPGATNAGQERGDPKYKDSYMFLTVNLGYKFSQKKRRHSSRAKF